MMSVIPSASQTPGLDQASLKLDDQQPAAVSPPPPVQPDATSPSAPAPADQASPSPRRRYRRRGMSQGYGYRGGRGGRRGYGFSYRRGRGGYHGQLQQYRRRFQPYEPWHRRPRTNYEETRYRRPDVYGLLTDTEASSKLSPEQMQKAEQLSTALMNLKPPTVPYTVFQAFVEDMRKADGRLTIPALRKQWDELPEKDRAERMEKTWTARQEFFAARSDFIKRKLDLTNELLQMTGRPPMIPRERVASGRDLFWKEVEAKVVAELPTASPYALEIKRTEMWRALPPKERTVFILRSVIEREKIVHTRRIAMLTARMQALKDSLVRSPQASAPVPAANDQASTNAKA